MRPKELHYRGTLEVNLDFLKSNLNTLRSLSSSRFFCPMIKAEAYGHGSVPITKVLRACKVKQVGVITLLEAKKIRENVGGDFDILIFGSLLNDKDQDEVIKNKFIPVLNQWSDLEGFCKKKQGLRIHIKFDTGFSRLGFSISDAEKVKAFLEKAPFLKLEGIGTQLLEGKDIINSNSDSSLQIKKLKELQTLFLAQYVHVFNTDALIASFVNETDNALGARPGIGLYGIKSSLDQLSSDEKRKWDSISLLPTTSLKSYVANVRELDKGDKVSYSGTWKAQKKSIIATIPLGYADFFSRSWEGAEVLLRGKRVSVVGRVCMDFFMIDVTSLHTAHPIQLKEEVVIFGKQEEAFISLEEHAHHMNTITHELFVGFGHRIKRSYIGDAHV